MVTLRELYKATTTAAKKMVADNTAEAPPSKDDPKLGGASDDKVFKATNVKPSTKPKNPMNEQEQLDELKADTYKKYIRHARADANNSNPAKHFGGKDVVDSPERKSNLAKKSAKIERQRSKGIQTAKKLLFKHHRQAAGDYSPTTKDENSASYKRIDKKMNEEQLNELKKETLAKYIVKASNDRASKEASIGANITKGIDKKTAKKSSNRNIGIVRAVHRLTYNKLTETDAFLNFIVEVETEKKDGRSEKNSAVPSASSPEDAENKAKRFYNLAKSTPTSEPEKKKHYMYIARKLYAKAKALRKTNKVNG